MRRILILIGEVVFLAVAASAVLGMIGSLLWLLAT